MVHTWRYHILNNCSVLIFVVIYQTSSGIFQLIINSVCVNGVFSELNPQYEGGPQGSVLQKKNLFILAINEFAQQFPKGARYSLYVDFSIWFVYNNDVTDTNILQQAINLISLLNENSWFYHSDFKNFNYYLYKEKIHSNSLTDTK